MIGKIFGKTSTMEFKLKLEGNAKKYQYIKIRVDDYDVLAQIIEIEKTLEGAIASCIILGYKEDNSLKPLRFPLNPGTKVEVADEKFISSSLGLENEKGAFLGTIEYTDVRVHIDLNKLLSKHLFVVARSGSGKSYCTGILVEEILDRNIPLLIIDPHAEYSSLKFSNTEDKEKLEKLNLKPIGYSGKIQEYTPDVSINSSARQLKLSIANMSPSVLLHLLPAKLSNLQIGLLYSSLQSLDKINFDDLIISLDTEETNAKYTLINLIEQIKKLNIFSEAPTAFQELIQPGKCSIINLKGISPEIAEIIVYKLVSDLFEARKLGNIPPFFLVIEEAQNFAPERGFGEAKSSPVLRKVLAEGRKFGLGVCLITQRPSRIDKCLTGDSPIYLEDGSVINIEEAFNKHKNGNERIIYPKDLKIYSLNKNDYTIRSTKVISIAKKKNKDEILNIKTTRGSEIKCTKEHKFLIFRDGFKIIEKKAQELNKEDFVIIPDEISFHGSNKIIYNKDFIREVEIRKLNIKKRIFAYESLKKLNTKTISKRFDIPHTTIKNWKWNLQIPNYLHHKNLLEKNYLFSKYINGHAIPIRIPSKVTPSLAQFFALLVSECHEPLKSSSYTIRFTNTDHDLIELFRKCCKDLFGLLATDRHSKKTSLDIEIRSNLLEFLLKEFGYPTRMKARKKVIPDLITRSTKEIIREFLRILFDCEGSVTKSGVVLASTSKDIIIKSSFMLKRLNIEHTIYTKKKIYKNEPYLSWQIIILTASFEMFEKTVGFSIKSKIEKLNELIFKTKSSKKYTVNNYVPINERKIYNIIKKIDIQENLKRRLKKGSLNKFLTHNLADSLLSYGEISKHLPQFKLFMEGDIKLDKVKQIKILSKKATVYDIETKNGNFISGAGGIIVHNSAISQCTTQIILKVTNPNDLRSISASVEGITAETEKEIKNLPIGTALLVGVVPQPLFVNIRPRKSKHGGIAIDILGEDNGSYENKEDSHEETPELNNDLIPIIKQKISLKDLELMSKKKMEKKETILIPCLFLQLQRDANKFNILINLNENKIITNLEDLSGILLPGNLQLSGSQLKVLKPAVELKQFTPAELFNKSKLQFSEVYDTIKSFTEKGFFSKEGNKYELSRQLQIFSDIQKYNCYTNPEYIKMKYTKKLDANYKKDGIISLFSNFFQVVNSRECYLEYFIIGYEEAKEKD